jgi:hypothetical protein
MCSVHCCLEIDCPRFCQTVLSETLPSGCKRNTADIDNSRFQALDLECLNMSDDINWHSGTDARMHQQGKRTKRVNIQDVEIC